MFVLQFVWNGSNLQYYVKNINIVKYFSIFVKDYVKGYIFISVKLLL